MTAEEATYSGAFMRRSDQEDGARPRFQRRVRKVASWIPVDPGGDDVIARLHMKLRPGPEAAREGRHALNPLDGAIHQAELETLRLLVTELVTNSVRHARARSWIALDVEVDLNAVRVAVTDRGGGFEPAAAPTPHTSRSGGWGLCLVDRLSDRWGVERDSRTSVWFEVDRSLAPVA